MQQEPTGRPGFLQKARRMAMPWRSKPQGQGAGRKRRFASLAIIALIAAWPQAQAQDAVYSADRVKAAFLYHFATYVDWPDAGRSDDVFTIAVLGGDEIALALEEFLPGHTIEGRPMEVRRLRGISDLGKAEVLFIGADKNSRLASYLDEVESRPVLVVTDVREGLREGAMINFRIVDNRVRFEISLRAADGAGLEMSSRLLSAAMSVDAAGAIIDTPATVVASDYYRELGR